MLGKATRRTLAAGLVVAAAGAWDSWCSGTKPTELVPGVLTQVQVPRDLSAIQVLVTADGAQVFCEAYTVYDGKVELPRTLGVVSGASETAIVAVTISGYVGDAATTVMNSACAQLPAVDAPGNAMAPRVLRRSIQSYVDGHILFVPMPLTYSCFDVDCSTPGNDQTCRGATCQDAHVDAHSLVDFDEALVDGTGLCFSPTQCFADAAPAVLLDADKCVYGFPFPPPGTGLNVRVFYEDFAWVAGGPPGHVPQLVNAGEKQILDLDPIEGFTAVPSMTGTQFQLAPGLCQLVKNAVAPPPPDPMNMTKPFHVISAVQVASACPSKTPLLPLCASDGASADGAADAGGNLPDGATTADGGCNVGVPLEPAPSALYVVADDSHRMHAAYGAGGFATVVGLSLDNPVFRRLYVAFKRFAHQQSDCNTMQTSTTLTMPDVTFGLARANQMAIANLIGNGAMASDLPYYLQGAMRAHGAYEEVTSAPELSGLSLDKRAVMFFLNAAPDSTTDCSPTLDGMGAVSTLSTEAAAQPSVETYFVLLPNDDSSATQAARTAFSQVMGATVIDATGPTNAALLAFEPAIESLATCLYEKPSNVVDGTAQIAYVPPLGAPVSVPYDAACSAANASANGWAIDSGRIRICGQPCADLRAVVGAVTGQAFQSNTPAPDVPVTATIACH